MGTTQRSGSEVDKSTIRALELEVARLNGIIDGLRMAVQALRPVETPFISPSVWPVPLPPMPPAITTWASYGT